MICPDCNSEMDKNNHTVIASDGLAALCDTAYYKCPECKIEIDEEEI